MTPRVRSPLAAGVIAVAALAAGCGAAAGPAVATAPPQSSAAPGGAADAPNSVETTPPDDASATISAPAAVPSPASSPSAVAFSTCMRAHGVPTFPDPDSSGAIPKPSLQQLGVTALAFSSASSACQNLVPVSAAGPRRSPDVAQALRFAQCMRANGEPNFPDPAGDGRIPEDLAGINQGSAVFQAANDACAANRPPYMPSNAQYNAWASAQP